jgi:hypothetical protein
MTRKQTINLAAHYEALDTLFGSMEETERLTVLAITDDADLPDLQLVTPSIASCQRRLLTLAAAMGRVLTLANDRRLAQPGELKCPNTLNP